jgi:hypothetical protein
MNNPRDSDVRSKATVRGGGVGGGRGRSDLALHPNDEGFAPAGPCRVFLLFVH